MPERKFDLEERMICFASTIIGLAEKLPPSVAGKHLCGQLVRSGISPALMYGEAQAAESRADFIHKMKIGLKELRETMVNLKIIQMRQFLDAAEISAILIENNELISIFVKSIATAKANKLSNREP